MTTTYYTSSFLQISIFLIITESMAAKLNTNKDILSRLVTICGTSHVFGIDNFLWKDLSELQIVVVVGNLDEIENKWDENYNS